VAVNTLLTIQMITNELLLRFKNNLGFSGAIDHTWDDKFAVTGAKIGDTLRLRDPVRYNVTKGRVITPQDTVETQKFLVLNQQAVVPFQFTSAELTLSIDAFRERYLDSAAVSLANQVDVDGLTMAYQSTGNQVGAPGTPITTSDPFWAAGETLDLFSAPMDGKRTMCLSPKLQTSALKVFEGKFQSSNQIKQQYERGRMGIMGGFEWVMDQNVRVHTVGPLGGAPQVTTANQVGYTLLVSGFTASAALRLRKGDSFTLPTVFAVNAVSGDPQSDLLKFVVTADVNSAADGTASIPIYPPIIVAGTPRNPYQTVTNSPAAGAPLTITSGTANQLIPQNLAFHQAAFTIGMAPLAIPAGVNFAANAVDPDTGVSIRTISDYDIINDLFITRCDVLYGHAAPRPEWAVRVVQ
jgi:P22 coat protein - gene protein 5